MKNEDKLINSLLAGAKDLRADVKIAALIAIGDSGMIGDDKLVSALQAGASDLRADVKCAALTGIGYMLKNSNRQ